MLLLYTAVLLAMQLENGDFSQGLGPWKVHRHGESGNPPSARTASTAASSHTLLLDSHAAAAGGVSQIVHATPGSLWRLNLRSCPQSGGLVLIDSPSGIIGRKLLKASDSWSAHEIEFRIPSPGEAEVHLDNATEDAVPVTGRTLFADVRLEKIPEPEAGGIRIFLDRPGERPVDAKQQGQFIEYLCRLVPSMLAQQVEDGDFEEEPPYKYSYKGQIDHAHRPWYPDGAVHVAEYSYETREPFNGKRSQKIVIPLPTVRAGIAQDGFYLKAGIHYRLRLHAKITGEIRGRAMLRDSEGSIAQALLGSLDSSWKPVEVMLGAARSSPDATLALEFEGPGTVWLDRIYLIGDDAVLGLWREDVVEALRQLHPGVIRFGGTSVEGYEWKQTIGGWDSRVPFTTYWGGLELNFVGLDEFVQLCRHVGAEPLICVRWTGKSPADAAAEVEYLNGAANTRWGSVRASNGHPEPYGVKYWQIGNEVGGHEYTRSIAAFGRAMRAVDPTIKLISSYPSHETVGLAGEWLDYLAPHHYDFGDMTDITREFDAFREQIRQAKGRDIRVAVTEWNTTGGEFGLKRGILQTLGNALSCSRYHNLLQRNADLVEIAIRSNLIDSFGSGVLLTGPGWMYESPTYYAEQLYQRAAGSLPVMAERDSPLAWALQEPDISAALTPDQRTLRIYAVNSTPSPLMAPVALTGGRRAAGADLFVLKDSEATPDSEAMNSPADPRRIRVHERKDAGIAGERFRLSFEPYSVSLAEIHLER
jgi:alpha-L-arabinofuranosidase